MVPYFSKFPTLGVSYLGARAARWRSPLTKTVSERAIIVTILLPFVTNALFKIAHLRWYKIEAPQGLSQTYTENNVLVLFSGFGEISPKFIIHISQSILRIYFIQFLTAFRNNYSCETVLLRMPLDFKKSIDSGNMVAKVAIDVVMLLQACPMGYYMMTSSNGNIFRITGHLCGEFIGHRWLPRTKASDAELWCFLSSAPD